MLSKKLANILINKLRNISLVMIKGPQLQEKDVVLVKIVAHKGRHKL